MFICYYVDAKGNQHRAEFEDYRSIAPFINRVLDNGTDAQTIEIFRKDFDSDLLIDVTQYFITIK